MNQASEKPLQSWKEIAAYLERDVRTAHRWEKEAGLPVRRHTDGKRSSVYAYASEIEQWRASRSLKEDGDQASTAPFWKRLWPIAASVAFAATAWVLIQGPILNPKNPLVEAADPDGVTARRVWHGDEVDAFGALSPDGKLLAYNIWAQMSVGIHDLKTGKNTNLLPSTRWDKGQSAMFPVFSPDGKEVAYVWFDPDTEPEGTEVGIVGVNGRNARRVYSNPEYRHTTPVAWFPDGKRLLLFMEKQDKTKQLSILTIETGDLDLLVSLGWQDQGFVRISPDGGWVAYEQDDDVLLVAADGSVRAKVAPSPAEDSVMGWTPDGKGLLFLSDRSGAFGLWSVRVEEGRPMGEPRLIRPQLGAESTIGLSPEGTLYYGVRAGRNKVLVGSWDIAAGRALERPEELVRSFVGPHKNPVWSPDGRYLAFMADQNRLQIEDVETGEGRVLTEKFGYTSDLDWSPDGNSIAISTYGDNRGQGIYIADVPSGSLRLAIKRTEDVKPLRPRWAPGGKAIYYRRLPSDSDGAIVRHELSTGEETLIFEDAYSVGVARSDGRLALCVKLDGDERGLFVADAEGRGAKEIYRVGATDELSFPVWTPDGQFIIFWHRRNQRPDPAKQTWELMRIAAGGGEPLRLQLDEEDARSHISIHPDGKRIAFSVNSTSQEVWVLENFLPASTTD